MGFKKRPKCEGCDCYKCEARRAALATMHRICKDCGKKFFGQPGENICSLCYKALEMSGSL